MLAFYHKLAVKLAKIRWLVLLINISALLAFIYLIAVAEANLAQQWQLTSIVIWLFSLLAYLISLLFIEPIAQVNPKLGFIAKVSYRLQLIGKYLLALFMSGLVFTIIFIGLRALLGIIRSLFF
ncbi:hypothetical protein [Rheinheimera sp. MMS21-TC3]|uniref:hypothetical protein n=1 Tax=Rheinheimera sp. MMS21-TC3 TaxID=3072790 RepID=UPI0028C507E8|nr:hypothetical protein [Rheinheimera sp. MMS21-TC3]WNO61175.1 hypothetical protein RDV63_09505 [Rheinheimera sp. MMS21-TC3]